MRYGSKPLPVQVQAAIAERRLQAAAHAQAKEYAAGWRITGTEREIDGEINGLAVRGRIDRVERNEETGVLRVLDYKTSGKAKSHWMRTPPDGRYHAELRGGGCGDQRQGPAQWLGRSAVPLYYWALETEADNGLQLGYFNLPTVGADTGVQLMEGYSPDMHANAMACATAIVDRVQAGEFGQLGKKCATTSLIPSCLVRWKWQPKHRHGGNAMSDSGSILGSEMIRASAGSANRIGW